MTTKITPQWQKNITPELHLVQHHEIPMLQLQHAVGTALISLQGAQLLSWQPKSATQDILWLSSEEPFKLGNAIRGGVPICFPWFGPVQQPSHGTARLRLWQLSDYDIQPDKVRLDLSLFSADQLIEAKISFCFAESCTISFQHYHQEPAQVALHSYFNVANIEQVEVQNLPTDCFNSLIKQRENVPTNRVIQSEVDCIYNVETDSEQRIVDHQWQRQIRLQHHNASQVVLWNPWHKPTSAMSKTDYQTMLCLETARIYQRLAAQEVLSVSIDCLA